MYTKFNFLKEYPCSYYASNATKLFHNNLTQRMEPYFPKYIAFFRRFIGFLILTLFAIIAMFLHSIIILVRFTLHHLLFLTEGLRPFASVFSNITCGSINLLIIILIDKVYEKLAKNISKWGNLSHFLSHQV